MWVRVPTLQGMRLARILVPTALAGLAGIWLGFRRISRCRPESRPLRLDVILAAHDRADDMRDAVYSLRAADYPIDLRRILVVADHCQDGTALEAARHGAVVLVRNHGLGGRFGALLHAVRRVIDDGFADGVVLITEPRKFPSDLLDRLATAFAQGQALKLDGENRALLLSCKLLRREAPAQLKSAVLPMAELPV